MTNRYTDLLKQGFMKPATITPPKPRKIRPMVACRACQDWHPKGKHTTTTRPVRAV